MSPDTDGIDHINIYTKGKTALGRALTNLSNYAFIYEGTMFQSMEAFWFYHKHQMQGLPFEGLPMMKGFDAKQFGKKHKQPFDYPVEFIDLMKEGMKCRLRQNPKLLRDLVDSHLPLVHYYAYGSSEKGWKVIELPEYQWICDLHMELRTLCQNHYKQRRV